MHPSSISGPRHSAVAAALRTSLGAGRTAAHLGDPSAIFSVCGRSPNTTAGKRQPERTPPQQRLPHCPFPLLVRTQCGMIVLGLSVEGGACSATAPALPPPLDFFFDVTVGGIQMHPPTHPHPCGATARPPCQRPFHTLYDNLVLHWARVPLCVPPFQGAGDTGGGLGLPAPLGTLVPRRGAPDGGRVHRGLAVSSTLTTGTHTMDSRALALTAALPAPQPTALLCVAR
jgi:hypothetical protein